MLALIQQAFPQIPDEPKKSDALNARDYRCEDRFDDRARRQRRSDEAEGVWDVIDLIPERWRVSSRCPDEYIPGTWGPNRAIDRPGAAI